MNAFKILLILSAVCFSIGAVVGAFGGSGLPINWLCAGAAFYVWAQVSKTTN